MPTAQLPLDLSAAPSPPSPPPEAIPPFQAAGEPGEYLVARPVTLDEVCTFIRQELEQRFLRDAPFTSAVQTQDYLIARLAQEEREVFATLFLDTRHRLLQFEALFAGTIDSCAVHVREVAKRALALNAAAVVLAHNHPSGHPEPSVADQNITERRNCQNWSALTHVLSTRGKT